MTEIEIETYLYSSTSDEENEYSLIVITPDSSESNNKNTVELNEFIYNNDNLSITHERKRKKSFSQFISRQNAANERRIKSQNQEPSESQFNSFSYQYVLKSAVPPPKDSQSKLQQKIERYPPIYQRNANFKAKNSNTSNYKRIKSNIFETNRPNEIDGHSSTNSLAKSNTSINELTLDQDAHNSKCSTAFNSPSSAKGLFSEPLNQNFSLISEKSENLANERIISVINSVCGSENTINRYNLQKTLRQFSILDKSLISQFVFDTEIKNQQSNSSGIFGPSDFSFDRTNEETEELYDNQKVKEILINSILKKKNACSSLFEKQVKMCILQSLPKIYSNMKK